ncbi:MAG: LuxR C-terminal-related transcriptional regulator [Acidobacteriia bacterium]|nr:LuxR C-terminal-related transcriptional regulator [Terriglobia bacterium]
MRTSPALTETAREARSHPVDEVIRTLVGLLEAGSEVGTIDRSPHREQVLLDAEVGGCRYLLVRLPRSEHSPIRLSPREQEIVRMVANGHPNKVIADVLGISTWTVCAHLRRTFAKLGVTSRAAMVAQLSEMGLLTNNHRATPDSRPVRSKQSA